VALSLGVALARCLDPPVRGNPCLARSGGGGSTSSIASNVPDVFMHPDVKHGSANISDCAVTPSEGDFSNPMPIPFKRRNFRHDSAGDVCVMHDPSAVRVVRDVATLCDGKRGSDEISNSDHTPSIGDLLVHAPDIFKKKRTSTNDVSVPDSLDSDLCATQDPNW
jgi:hypothetical protein